jgi:MFS family permease
LAEPPAFGHRLALLTAASAGVALAAADTYVVVLALTDMMAGVGIGIDALQRATPIISGFLLGYIVVLPLIGRLSDLLDRRRILLGCLVVFVVGSALTALAVELPVLVSGRVLQGVGGGGLVPATLALVADLWPAERRGTPLGVVGAVQELGSVLGPVLGAVILAWSGWRAIFWANVVAGLLLYAVIRVLGSVPGRSPRHLGPRRGRAEWGRWAAIGAWALAALAATLGALALLAPEGLVTDVTLGLPFVPLAGDSRVLTPIGLTAVGLVVLLAVVTAPRWWAILRQADPFGALLVAVALGSLVLTFASSDPEKEVVGPLGYRLLPCGAVAMLALVWWHRRAAAPLVPRGVVHSRGMRAFVVSLLVGVALVAVIVDVPLLARLTESYDATGGALVLARFLVAVPVGALLGGWSLRWLGDGAVAGVGLLLTAAGMLVMSTWTLASIEDTAPATAVLVVVGLGVGLALAPVNNAALADSPDDAHGVASSLVVVARMVGMVVGLALLTSIGLNRYYDAVRRLPDPLDTDALIGAGVVQVQTVFLGGAVAALLGALVAFSLGLRARPVVGEVSPGLRGLG